MSIQCSLGHRHDGWQGTGCGNGECSRCFADCDERPCDVAQFVFDTAPDCRRTFLGCDTADLTGFTTRAAAALIHLREAWCNADPTNRPGVAMAIARLMETRSLAADRERYEEFLRFSLDGKRGDEIVEDYRCHLRGDS